MRFMYDATNPGLIPAEAEIVAYWPSRSGEPHHGLSNALQIMIDDTGDQWLTCHVLDLMSESSRNVNGRQWVEKWWQAHPNGMSAVNGWITRPVVMVAGPAARYMYAACQPHEIDLWGVDCGDDGLPIAGCFARKVRMEGTGGALYGVSRVYRDDWGKRPIAVTETPKRITRWPAIRGAVWYKDQDGNLISADVTSFDVGATWQRS